MASRSDAQHLGEPREAIEADRFADMVSTVLEGGVVMSKALAEPRILEWQLLVFRSFVKLLFAAPPPARAATVQT